MGYFKDTKVSNSLKYTIQDTFVSLIQPSMSRHVIYLDKFSCGYYLGTKNNIFYGLIPFLWETDMVLYHVSISRNCRTLMYPYFSLKTNFKEKCPDISKFQAVVSMIHPELTISTPFNVFNWIPGNGLLRTLQYPICSPKTIFCKMVYGPHSRTI